jgi:transcriptional regulator with XRE-family HTH domain
MTITGSGRAAFSVALGDALRERGWTQNELAVELGTTQSAVSGWVHHRTQPRPPVVDRIEQLLDLPAGDLSRHLGYLSLSFESGSRRSVSHALETDEWIDDTARAAVMFLYNHYRSTARAASFNG